MSLGEGPDAPDRRQAALRAMAHPVRLQILSLLTGHAMTAAEVARELGLTHANASYHLRNLLNGGLVVLEGEERIRGGVAKRYRYDATRQGQQLHVDNDGRRALYAAVANELTRRSALVDSSVPGSGTVTDAELWIDEEQFRDFRDRMVALTREMHAAAQAPRTPGTIRTNTTVVMFRMEEQ